MKLDQLVHWCLEGTPDRFTEQRDGEEWQVIHSGGSIHDAGFLQTVYFDRPVKAVSLSVMASLYTTGGGLMLRLGIDPKGGVNQLGPGVKWSGWFGPDNDWDGWARYLEFIVRDLNTDAITIFLRSECRWPVESNTSRWRDVQLQVEYAGTDPPVPEPPEPDPDTPEAIRTLQEAMVLSTQLLEQAGKMTMAIGQVLALFDQEPEV